MRRLFDHFFSHTKGDQEGINRNEPWHIYSNPMCPEICPILALAKYVFTQPSLLAGDCRLFPGDSQYNYYMCIFCDVLKENKVDFVGFNVNIDGIGLNLM